MDPPEIVLFGYRYAADLICEQTERNTVDAQQNEQQYQYDTAQ